MKLAIRSWGMIPIFKVLITVTRKYSSSKFWLKCRETELGKQNKQKEKDESREMLKNNNKRYDTFSRIFTRWCKISLFQYLLFNQWFKTRHTAVLRISSILRTRLCFGFRVQTLIPYRTYKFLFESKALEPDTG